MATFKCEVREHQQRADGSWNVKLRVTHRRQSRWLATSIDVTRQDLSARGTKIRAQRVLDRCEDLLRRVRAAVAGLSPFALDAMDVSQLVRWIEREMSAEGWRLDFFAWGRECMGAMSAGARGNYRNALNAFARFLGRDAIDINDIRAADIRAFGDWLDAEPKQQGNKHGGGSRTTGKGKIRGGVSSTYVRSLSRLHTLARERYNDPDAERQRIPRNPFEGYKRKAPTARGGQRSLGIAGIQALIDAEKEQGLRWEKRSALAVFLLSFCLMGVNIADLYEAHPVEGEWWVYRRKKVRERKGADAEIRVRIPAQAQRYIDALRDTTGAMWLQLYRWNDSAARVSQKVDRRLRWWARDAGWSGADFTFYAARHSWGTIAHGAAGGDMGAVDEALGHNGRLDMANIYIEKDWQMLNAINERVLALFRW